MTHQHTWNTVAGTASVFAVKGALIGDELQQNFAAILSVAAVLVGFYFQIQDRRRANQLAALVAERDEAKIQAEIERIKRGEIPDVAPGGSGLKVLPDPEKKEDLA